jgi:predicted nucleotide-binding protein
MAERKSTFRGNQPVPSLIIPRTEAESKIFERVSSGNKLLELSIYNEKDLEAAKAKRKKWNDDNEALLRRVFNSEVFVEDYNRSSMLDSSVMKASWAHKISGFYDGISNKIEALESIIKRLEFIPEKITPSETQEKNRHRISDTASVVHNKDDETNESTIQKPEVIPEKVIITEARERYEPESDTASVVHSEDDATNESTIQEPEVIPEKVIISKAQERHEPEISNTVLVVHGHDDKFKVSVVRFIEKLGLKPAILHDQENAGQTIIEKFERNAAISGYAVVILTPDDTGALKEHPDDATLRAGQNVIFGLGYISGALGRAKVSVLVKEGLEILCDDLGVEYTLMDPEGTWQLSLARDMKSAGLSFDANRIF